MTLAAAMTYDTLVTDVTTYAERDDMPFTTQIPRFIMQAENRICSSLRGLGLLQVVTGNLTQGNTTLPKPTRWRETSSFSITDPVTGVVTYMFERGYDYLKTYWPNVVLQGKPAYYSNFDYEHFYIAGTPDANYAFQLMYYERPQPLDSNNQTNFLTQYYPQLLLYGTLLEAQPFLKLPERIPEFRSFYDEAVKNYNQENLGRSQDQANLRMNN